VEDGVDTKWMKLATRVVSVAIMPGIVAMPVAVGDVDALVLVLTNAAEGLDPAAAVGAILDLHAEAPEMTAEKDPGRLLVDEIVAQGMGTAAPQDLRKGRQETTVLLQGGRVPGHDQGA